MALICQVPNKGANFDAILIIGIAIVLMNVQDSMLECSTPSTPFTFLAANSSEGAALAYYWGSNSRDRSFVTVFTGHFLSSDFACGDRYERCPNLTVVLRDDVVVVVIPMLEFVGLAIFEWHDEVLIYRRQFVANLTSLDLGCEVLSIFEFPLVQVAGSYSLAVNCLYHENGSSNQLLDLIRIDFNSTHISNMKTITESNSCHVNSLSQFQFFTSLNFETGAMVFASGVQVRFHTLDGNYCGFFSKDTTACSEVQRLSWVPPDDLCLYCINRTFLFNLNRLFLPFIRNMDGLPFFCSRDFYYSYLDGVLFLHRNDANRTQISAHDFRRNNVLSANEEIVWGECVQSKSVVLHTDLQNVILFLVNSSIPLKIDTSKTTPRIFDDAFVLLKDDKRASVYSVHSGQLLQQISQPDFIMGYVMSSSRSNGVEQSCTTSSLTSADRITTTSLVTTPVGSLSAGSITVIVVVFIVLVLIVVVVVIGCIIHKIRRRQRPWTVQNIQLSGRVKSKPVSQANHTDQQQHLNTDSEMTGEGSNVDSGTTGSGFPNAIPLTLSTEQLSHPTNRSSSDPDSHAQSNGPFCQESSAQVQLSSPPPPSVIARPSMDLENNRHKANAQPLLMHERADEIPLLESVDPTHRPLVILDRIDYTNSQPVSAGQHGRPPTIAVATPIQDSSPQTASMVVIPPVDRVRAPQLLPRQERPVDLRPIGGGDFSVTVEAEAEVNGNGRARTGTTSNPDVLDSCL